MNPVQQFVLFVILFSVVLATVIALCVRRLHAQNRTARRIPRTRRTHPACRPSYFERFADRRCAAFEEHADRIAARFERFGS